MYEFVIEGKVKPYVRMTRRGKFVNPQAQQYLASQDDIRWQIKNQMAKNGWQMLPKRTPLRVEIIATYANRLHASDLDNTVKALTDAAQGFVYHNDCWIDEQYASRQLGNDWRYILRVGPIDPTPTEWIISYPQHVYEVAE